MSRFCLTVLLPTLAFGLAVPNLDSRQAAPFSQQQLTPWNSGSVSQYPIHSSCNATQRHMIASGLNETIELAAHARDHVLRWGNSSEHYRKYFGDRPTFEVVGAYDAVVNGDKGGVLFRCDNPDGNCRFPDWGGHWRGSNATDETVICDLSYRTRRPLAQMCMLGYTVARSASNTFWASDLLHRLYHMPAIGQSWIKHFADNYAEVVELAASNKTESTHDSDTLQFFALDVYAFDVAAPGIGCSGSQAITSATASYAPGSTVGPLVNASTSATSAASMGATRVVPGSASTTLSVPPNCHTHEGGMLHCT